MRKRAFCAICVLLASFSAGATIAAAAAGRAAENYDYSDPAISGYSTLGEADLLADYFKDAGGISDLEKAYLTAHGAFSLRYSEAVGASNIAVSFEEGGALEVGARPVSYTAKNGATVVWTPETVNGDPLTLENGEYRWRKASVGEGDGDTVSVGYKTAFPVGQSALNAALNRTYFAAQAASAKLDGESARYERESAQYESDLETYGQYLADMEDYREKLAAYEVYEEEYNRWNERNLPYLAYLEEYKEYEKEQKVYQEAFSDYEKRRAQYDRNLQRYEDYCAEYTEYKKKYQAYLDSFDSPELLTVLRQVGYLEFMYSPTVRQDEPIRTIYSALMGNAVMIVVENKDIIAETVRGTGPILNEAEESLFALRTDLLPTYNSLKTNEEKYQYYITYYDQLSRRLNQILQSLDKLYQGFTTVHKEIEGMGRTWQFRIALAQLYIMCNLLSDGPVPTYDHVHYKTGTFFDETYSSDGKGYTIDGMTPAQILGNTVCPEDIDDAKPLEGGVPHLPEEPVAPTPVADPGAEPKPPVAPVKPKPVADPGPAPEVVERPEEPETVEEPTAPVRYLPTEEELALKSAYDGGLLRLREEREGDYLLTVRTQVIRYFRNAQVIIVRFFAEEYPTESEPTYVVEADRGDFVAYPYELPEKERFGYTCTFECWVDSAGEPVDLTRLASDSATLDLYPKFTETPNTYAIYWSVNGVTYEDSCAYDAVPAYDAAKFVPLERAPKGGRIYRFIGWKAGDVLYNSEDLPPVTGESVTYTAEFEESLLVTWNILGTQETVPVWRGEVPAYDGVPRRTASRLYYYFFTGWSLSSGGTPVELAPVERDITYYAQFGSEYLVGGASGGASVTVTDGVYSANALTLTGPYTVEGIFVTASLESAGVELRLSGCTLTFSAETVKAFVASGVRGVKTDLRTPESNVALYSVVLTDTEGAEVVPNASFRFETTASFDDTTYLRMFRTDSSGDTQEARYTYDAATRALVIPAMSAGGYYEIYARYAVDKVTSDEHKDLQFSVDRDFAREGESVRVTVEHIPAGMSVSEVYFRYSYVSEAGETVTVRRVVEGGAFVMPAYPVLVGVVLVQTVYTVRFISDGKVLLTGTYYYGDIIEKMPSPPVKPMDDEYQYVFIGWDKDVKQPVTGDIDFVAQFRADPIESNSLYKGPSLAYRVYLTLVIGGPIFVVLVGGVITFFVVRRKRKNRK